MLVREFREFFWSVKTFLVDKNTLCYCANTLISSALVQMSDLSKP